MRAAPRSRRSGEVGCTSEGNPSAASRAVSGVTIKASVHDWRARPDLVGGKACSPTGTTSRRGRGQALRVQLRDADHFSATPASPQPRAPGAAARRGGGKEVRSEGSCCRGWGGPWIIDPERQPEPAYCLPQDLFPLCLSRRDQDLAGRHGAFCPCAEALRGDRGGCLLTGAEDGLV